MMRISRDSLDLEVRTCNRTLTPTPPPPLPPPLPPACCWYACPQEAGEPGLYGGRAPPVPLPVAPPPPTLPPTPMPGLYGGRGPSAPLPPAPPPPLPPAPPPPPPLPRPEKPWARRKLSRCCSWGDPPAGAAAAAAAGAAGWPVRAGVRYPPPPPGLCGERGVSTRRVNTNVEPDMKVWICTGSVAITAPSAPGPRVQHRRLGSHWLCLLESERERLLPLLLESGGVLLLPLLEERGAPLLPQNCPACPPIGRSRIHGR